MIIHLCLQISECEASTRLAGPGSQGLLHPELLLFLYGNVALIRYAEQGILQKIYFTSILIKLL